MRLRALELDEFRSFRRLLLPIDPAGFRAIGPNASGKSTILEAIAMLATTRSPRTAAEREIAHWESGVDLAVPPYSRLRGEFERVTVAISSRSASRCVNEVKVRSRKWFDSMISRCARSMPSGSSQPSTSP